VWWAVLGGLVVAGLLAVALTSGGGESSDKLEVAKSVTVDGTSLAPFTSPVSDPAVGTHAPTLTGKTFDRSAITVGGTGVPHVLVFVAHWCPHCQAEVPRIVALQRAGRTSGVPVTAVATGTDTNAPNYPPSAWLHREGWPYPVLVDTASGTAASAYGLRSYPFLVFVDASGNVAARVSGEIEPADLKTMFAALAAGKPVPVPNAGAASSG
jgi:thiol-disulfide isomerase/thioredoxin